MIGILSHKDWLGKGNVVGSRVMYDLEALMAFEVVIVLGRNIEQ